MKKPVELDKEYEAKIEEISRRGDGIAKIEGFIIFVPNTKQGDDVKFKITRVGNRFATAELV
jgi:predicted RNA-binding protein with TRAM domain